MEKAVAVAFKDIDASVKVGQDPDERSAKVRRAKERRRPLPLTPICTAPALRRSSS
jgi:hypothetical protein